ncbi:hypothetical protein D3C72_1598430 [compost metagenome]
MRRRVRPVADREVSRGAGRVLSGRRVVSRRQCATHRPLHTLRHAFLRADLRQAGARRREAGGGLQGAGQALRQGYPPLVRRGWRRAGLRTEPDLSVCLRRHLGRARLCRSRGFALGRDQGAVFAAPALVGRQADCQPRWRAVGRLWLSEPVHVRELQFGRFALLGAQGFPAAGFACRSSLLDG